MNAGAPSPLVNLLPLIFVVFIFYFLIIRPQQKKQKEHAQMLAALEKNDEVVTAGGVHATVAEVREKTVILKIADNVRIEIEKEFIARVAAKK